MRYQDERLPEGAVKAGETPVMNQDNVFPGILEKHMAPKGKWGRVVVVKGSLEYVWEDTPEEIFTVDPEHSLVIEPERYHHVILTGDVEFKVEFYKVEAEVKGKTDKDAQRPGENFL